MPIGHRHHALIHELWHRVATHRTTPARQGRQGNSTGENSCQIVESIACRYRVGDPQLDIVRRTRARARATEPPVVVSMKV